MKSIKKVLFLSADYFATIGLISIYHDSDSTFTYDLANSISKLQLSFESQQWAFQSALKDLKIKNYEVG